MSLVRAAAIFIPAFLAAMPAAAQEPGADRFFAESIEEEEARQSTTVDGSFTSTTFYYREQAGEAPAVGATAPLAASPVDRIFTDLRTQLDAKHLGGSRVDFRADVRGRLNTTTYTTPAGSDNLETRVPYQSGTRYGNEIDIRELYFRRRGASVDLGVGRQYALELAATKFDGVKLEGTGTRWKYILFGGLHPSRISRDVRDDYPFADGDIMEDGYQGGGKTILPIAGGAGLAYRFRSAHGAIGAVGILPLADDSETEASEKARLFATANGYWRASQEVDVYHYLVADAAGADGARLTNFTLGLNLQPTPQFRAYANINRVDTETLNTVAQTQLQDPDGSPGNSAGTTLQNNIKVQRIAQDSARVGLSASFGDRLEVSTSGALRRRGELRIEPLGGDRADPTDDFVFDAAQAADITIALVDRKSLADMRVGLSGTRSFGVGNANLYRNKSLVARLDATKELSDGRAELEGSLTYINSLDSNRGIDCNTAMIDTCYGASELQSITAGALLFYRFSRPWFLITNVNVGLQISKSADANGMPGDQPEILTLGFLLRLAYRF